jgi:hypothetical protein
VVFYLGYDVKRVFFLIVSKGGHWKVVFVSSYLKVHSFAENCYDRTKLRFNTSLVGAVDSHEKSEVSCL